MTVIKRVLVTLGVCLGLVVCALPGVLIYAHLRPHRQPPQMVRLIGLRRGGPMTMLTLPPGPRPQALADARTRMIEVAPEQSFQDYRRYRPILRLWQDYTLGPDDEIGQVIVVSGTATIAGHVNSDVFVWLGDVKLTNTSVISGSLVVIAGNVTVEEGANVRRDLVVFGGKIDAPTTFTPGGDHFIIGTPAMGDDVRAIVPWITRGLLWGRIFVPSVPWIWAVFAIVFVVSLVLNHVFARAIGTTAQVVVTRPLSVFLAGLVVLLLTGPLFVILGASIVGLLVIPFLLCAAFIAWTVGKVAFARGLGMRVIPPSDPDSRFLAARSFIVGFALITLAYAVPILGLVTWALVSVFGLGAAGITVVATIRREYPAKPKAPKSAPVAPPLSPVAAAIPAVPLAMVDAPSFEAFRGDDAGTAAPPASAVEPGFRRSLGGSGSHAFSARGVSRSRGRIRARLPADRDRRSDAQPDACRRRVFRAAVRVSRRVLGPEGHDTRRDHLQPPRRSHQRRGDPCGGRDRARARQHPVARAAWHRLLLDAAGSAATDLARQDRGHVRRQGAERAGADVDGVQDSDVRVWNESRAQSWSAATCSWLLEGDRRF